MNSKLLISSTYIISLNFHSLHCKKYSTCYFCNFSLSTACFIHIRSQACLLIFIWFDNEFVIKWKSHRTLCKISCIICNSALEFTRMILGVVFLLYCLASRSVYPQTARHHRTWCKISSIICNSNLEFARMDFGIVFLLY